MFSATQRQSRLRTLLVLGRVSNLPTIWSNCLAAWWLGGGGSWGRFSVVAVAVSFMYVGGMFLNDAFDADFDRQHRKERPIPSGAITLAEVWVWGIFWLCLGAVGLAPLGLTTALLGLGLIGLILLYDAVHKIITFSPVLMAGCRFLVYMIAASAAIGGVRGLAVWSGLALGAYIVGLSYIARKEATHGPLKYWPSYLLAMPILIALIANQGVFLQRALLISLVFALWTLYCSRFTYWTGERNVGRTVSGLLAGIVWVDLLAVAGATPGLALIFVGLFLVALLFQRFIPAT